MKGRIQVLIVEDLPTDAELNKREVIRVLPQSEFRVVETREEFLEALESFRPDLILSDFKLPQFDGIIALQLAKEHAPDIPFIIVTGSMNEDTAVDCMKEGAWDYIIKEHIKRLGPAVLNSYNKKRSGWSASWQRLHSKETRRGSETLPKACPIGFGKLMQTASTPTAPAIFWPLCATRKAKL
jgi:DNA-binding NtrC family response regulator